MCPADKQDPTTMTTNELPEYDDLGEALREGRPLRPARSYRLLLANGDLNFQSLSVSDPVPLGRQILASAGLDPHDGYSLFAIVPTGDFEDVRLDEPFDLRARGAERFVAFATDREFKLTVRDQQVQWGKPAISGVILYKLANAAQNEAVFLEIPGGQDRLIEPGELVDLTGSKIERFIIGPKPPVTYEIVVNGRDRVVNDERVSYEQVVALAFPGCHDGNVRFAVTYSHAASKPHAGELGPGGFVNVKRNGTIFNVTKTNKS